MTLWWCGPDEEQVLTGSGLSPARYVVRNVVELVDVFPTVSYMAGLDAPDPCPVVSFQVRRRRRRRRAFGYKEILDDCFFGGVV